MVREQATVVATEGGRAWVEMVRQASCGGCGSSSSCGTSALSKLFGNRSYRVEVNNPVHAGVGSVVTVAVSEQGLMGGAARLYLLPLLALFLSLGVVEWLPILQEWIKVMVALVITVVAVVWMRELGWFEADSLTPEITEIHARNVDFIK